MAFDFDTALLLMKTRLNRLKTDTTLDDYFSARLHAVAEEFAAIGIHLNDSTQDLLLVVDEAVWQYQCRDQPGPRPEWLQLRRRERWLQEGGGSA